MESFRTQLKQVLPALLHSKIPSYAGVWKKEGVDHINISRSSSTRLGRELDFDNIRVFDHPILGSFKTLNSLWYFIKANNTDDSYRMMFGGLLRQAVMKNGGTRRFVLHIRAVMMHSAYLRILGNRQLFEEMKASTLPFDNYRELDSGIRQRFDMTPWMTGGYEEIRQAIKDNREPQFAHLMDTEWDWKTQGQPGQADIYKGVLEILCPPASDDGVVSSDSETVDEEAAPAGDAPVKKTRSQKNRERLARKRAAKAEAAANGETPQVSGDTVQLETQVNLADGELRPAPVPSEAETAARLEKIDTPEHRQEQVAPKTIDEAMAQTFVAPVNGEGVTPENSIPLSEIKAVETTSATMADIFNNLQPGLAVPAEVREADTIAQ